MKVANENQFSLTVKIGQAVTNERNPVSNMLTKGGLETYDRYWDFISTEKMLKADSYDKGMEHGIEQEKINSDLKITEEK
jgi:hypothetical protein